MNSPNCAHQFCLRKFHISYFTSGDIICHNKYYKRKTNFGHESAESHLIVSNITSERNLSIWKRSAQKERKRYFPFVFVKRESPLTKTKTEIGSDLRVRDLDTIHIHDYCNVKRYLWKPVTWARWLWVPIFFLLSDWIGKSGKGWPDKDGRSRLSRHPSFILCSQQKMTKVSPKKLNVS